MDESRIKELAKECSKKLNDLSDGIQDDVVIVLDYFCTVAVEAREEGIEEMYEWSVVVTQAHPGLEPELRMRADQLQEKS